VTRRWRLALAGVILVALSGRSSGSVPPPVRAQGMTPANCATLQSVQGPAGAAGIDPALNRALGPLTGFLEEQRSQLGLPGMSVAVVLDQQVIYARGFGCADLALQTPAAPGTAYLMGSVTKMLTATMLMQLRDAGKLQLDDPVDKYVPGLHYLSPSGATVSPTFRELVSHTSGLPDYIPNDPALLPSTNDDLLKELPSVVAVSEPGTQALYSDLGFDVLGYALSTIAGEPYESYVNNHILRPLEMADSGFVPNDQKTAALVQALTALPATEAAQLAMNPKLKPSDIAQLVSLYPPDEAAQILAALPSGEASQVAALVPSQPPVTVGHDPLLDDLATAYTTLNPAGTSGTPASPGFFTGASAPTGGMISTVLDLAKFLMLQFRDGSAGGDQVLSGSSLAEMQQPIAALDSTVSFGMGWEIFPASSATNGLTLIGKNGAAQGYQAQIQFVSGTKLGIAIAANLADTADPNSFLKVDGLASQVLLRLAPATSQR
jgi:CubicO group peptidase (beta-lactamase class C family)